MKSLVYDWLNAGAPFLQGARLFKFIYGRFHPFCIFLDQESKGVHSALKIALTGIAGIELNLPVAKTETKPAPKLREDWPFLSAPGCPPELKILAANKITAYHTYVKAHDQLFDCTSSAEQFETVKRLVDNYQENRKIIAEFLYYKEHSRVLGDHPVFKEFKAIKALRKLNVVELLQMKEKLEHNIWRIKSLLKKKSQTHLVIDRKKRLQEKKNLLAEVERLIKEYTQ